MIRIKVVIKDGETHISIVGHAGYADHGQDIVCAAISAISHTAVLGLNAVAQEYKEHVNIEIQQD